VFNGIQRHDGPVVVGISTLLVLVFLAINLVVDLLYGVLDPRIRVD
jgi:ABC-type dipeptide/oligopeptide/nickel transport system permease component